MDNASVAAPAAAVIAPVAVALVAAELVVAVAAVVVAFVVAFVVAVAAADAAVVVAAVVVVALLLLQLLLPLPVSFSSLRKPCICRPPSGIEQDQIKSSGASSWLLSLCYSSEDQEDRMQGSRNSNFVRMTKEECSLCVASTRRAGLETCKS